MRTKVCYDCKIEKTIDNFRQKSPLKKPGKLYNECFVCVDKRKTTIDSLEGEEWRSILGYEGIYEVSNLGRVKSLNRSVPRNNGGYSNYLSKLVKIYTCHGYSKVSFCILLKKKSFFVHRLVAQAFIPNPENKEQVNHVNGIKTDNRVENLEWNTCLENITHADKNGLRRVLKGSENGNSVFTEEIVLDIRKEHKETGCSLKSLSIKHNTTISNISLIIKRKNWKHI